MLKRARNVCIVFLAIVMAVQSVTPALATLVDEPDIYGFYEVEHTPDDADADIPFADDLSPDLPGEDAEDTEEPFDFPALETGEVELTGEDVVGEIVELREANVKHFRMSDGSRIAVVYDTEVHFQDEDGYWIDIDNSLTLDVAEDVRDAAMDDVFDALEELLEQEYDVSVEDVEAILEDSDIGIEDIVITTEDTLLDIHFNLGSGCEETPDFVLEHEGYTVGLSLLGAEEQIAEIVPTDPEPIDDTIAAAVQPANLTSRIIYRDVFPGVDLEYVLHGNEIKENIIVNHLLDSHTFFFELDLDGLRPVHNDDGSILLMSRDTDEEMFQIPAPFMFDDAGAYSEAVRYEIVPVGAFYARMDLQEEDAHGFEDALAWDEENADEDSRYLFVVVADEDWMRDAERAFPVTIDPPIVIRWGAGHIETVFVREGTPTTRATGAWMDLGFSELSTSRRNRIYVRANQLPQLPPGGIIVRAELALGQYPGSVGYSHVGMANMNVAAYGVPSAWNASRTAAAGITWANQPAFNAATAVMLDYVNVSNATNGAWRLWDVTGITRDWRYGVRPNNGVMLKAVEEATFTNSRAALARFASFSNSTRADMRPMFILQYRNTIGVASHFTYATQDIGRAGTGHVMDYSGQLTVMKPLVGHASTVNPFTLSLVYGSERFNTHFRTEVGRSAPRFDNMVTGHGWKLTAQQTIATVNLPNTNPGNNATTQFLVWTNVSGTEHYFHRVGTTSEWRDEDGLGLTITRSGTTDTMRDAQNNRKIFRNGILSETIDRNNNRILFIYNDVYAAITGAGWHPNTTANNRLLQIRQLNNGAANAITMAHLHYDTSHRLTHIDDRMHNRMTFHYAGSHLVRIQHTDATSAHYIYDGPGGRLSEVHDGESGRRIVYNWGACGQITGIHTHGSTAAGARIATPISRIWRAGGGETPGLTRYRDTGRDLLSETADDIVEFILFDNAGRTVNYYMTDYTQRHVLGASMARHTRNSGTDRRNNRTTHTSSIGVPAVNLLRNPGFESGAAHWNVWGAGNVTVPAANAANARTGERFKQITGPNDGGFNQRVWLTARTTYTFSAYVNTSAVTQFRPNANGDSGPILNFAPVATGVTAVRTDAFPIRTDANVNGGWQRISLSYTTGATAREYIVGFQVLGITGTLRADDFQLESVRVGTGASNVNLVQDGGFEFNDAMVTSTVATTTSFGGWTRRSTNITNVTADRLGGARSLRINGHPGRAEFAYQDVRIDLPGTETFVLSGWAKANSVPLHEDDNNPRGTTANRPSFGMVARITYADTLNTVAAPRTEDHHLRFNADIPARAAGVVGWQFASAPVVPRQPGRTVQTIRIYVHYNSNANAAWFDNISLVREAAQTMLHDANGNLISVSQTGMANVTAAYNANNQLLRQLVTPGSGTFDYLYDAQHNLTQVTNGTLRTNIFYNNAAGNSTGSILSSTIAGSPRLTTTAGFSADGNRMTARRDVNGTLQQMDYLNAAHEMFGVPSAVHTGRRQDWEQPHHSDREQTIQTGVSALNGRTTSVWQDGIASVAYSYNRGNLSQVRRVGFNGTTRVEQDYHFTYNDFGNMTAIRVGTRQLKSYGYNSDQSLNHRVYANRHRVDYTYDLLGRVSTVTHRQGTLASSPVHTVFTYQYTGDGQLHSVHDSATGVTQAFNYDSIGRLVGFTERNRNGSIRQSGHNRYDNAGRVVHFAYDIPTLPRGAGAAGLRRYAHIYNQTNGNLVNLWLATADHWHLNYTYDNLHRLQSRRLHGGTMWETSFTYRDRADAPGYSTQQVESLTYRIGNEVFQYWYEYDNMGNIQAWFNPNTGGRNSYGFDAQNQLVIESHHVASLDLMMHQFYNTFDTYGNVRSRWRRSANGDWWNPILFEYTNAQWRDLLTAITIDNVRTNITYDGNTGNPLNWHGNRNFTWARGRQLQRVTGPNGLDVTFTYGHDGIRQSKTVTQNGVTTEHTFYTQGGQIVGEVRARVGANGARSVTDRLEFIYDEAGRPVQLIHNGVIYNYVLNLQGDVHQIRRASDGIIVAVYDYNAWGEVLFSSGWMAQHNPLRYRGKYFDNSTGLYYLQSRFYDPVVGRFVNADAYISTGQGLLGFNMFTYCLNNPANFEDQDGYMALALARRIHTRAARLAFSGMIARINLRVAARAATQRANSSVGTPVATRATTTTTRTSSTSGPAPHTVPNLGNAERYFGHLRPPLEITITWEGLASGVDTLFAASEGAVAVAPLIWPIPIVGKAVTIYGIVGVVWNTNRRAGHW